MILELLDLFVFFGGLAWQMLSGDWIGERGIAEGTGGESDSSFKKGLCFLHFDHFVSGIVPYCSVFK